MIKVRTLKVTGRKEIPYEEGMTLADVLRKTKDEVPAGGTITVNRQVVTDMNATVPEGAVVVVTPPVENG